MIKNKTSLSKFINIRMTLIYLIVMAISVPFVYRINEIHEEEDALNEVSIIANMVSSIDLYIKDDLRQKILDNNVLASPEFFDTNESTRFMVELLKEHGDTRLLIYSDNYSQDKKIDAFGVSIIEQFKQDESIGHLSSEAMIDGQQYLYYAVPNRTKRIKGVVDGASVAAISLATIQRSVLEKSLLTVGLLTILFAVFVSSLNTTMRNHIINPMIRINNRTMSVSRGELGKEFKSTRTDEIGQLIGSIELLRRSLEVAFERMGRRD